MTAATEPIEARREAVRIAAARRRRNETRRILVRRLLWCLFGGFVLALMVGTQEGSQNDFGISFRHAVIGPPIVVFLAIGFVIFLLITFWPVVRPYIRRPGVAPLVTGFLVVVIG